MSALVREAEGMLLQKEAVVKAMAAKLSTIHCSGCANCSGIVGD